MKTKSKKKKQVIGFQVMEDMCIWMKAGMVNFRRCDNDFDCSSCPFDKAMRKAMKIGNETRTTEAAPRWVDYLQKSYQGHSRPCRHTLTGRIDAPKICTDNYECYHCGFDQMLDDMDLALDIGTPAYTKASGYKMADGYYYHLGHTWARFEHGGRARIGLDDFLVKTFGAPGSLSLPPLGERLTQGRVGWVFGRDDHRAAVLSPVTGTVLAVNHNAREHPEITHTDPYHEGWLVILEPDMPKRNLKGLYFGRESFDWMEQESQRLMRLMGPEYDKLAATGGELVGDIFGHFPDLGWDRLVMEFLHTGHVQ
jgi:glycine cleavage system H lipoate-binding protein